MTRAAHSDNAGRRTHASPRDRRRMQDDGSITPDDVREIRADEQWRREQTDHDPFECGS